MNGRIASGKTTFARELADVIQVNGRSVLHVGVDGFHNPRAIRYRQGRASARGYYEDAYDLDALATLRFLADQIGIEAGDLAGYATRHNHLAQLRNLYGLKSFTGRGAAELRHWLLDQAVHAMSNLDLAERFTDHTFALTALLGYQFVSRIRNLSSKRLFLFGPAAAPKNLRGLIGGKA